jgi:hypothetical protein
MKVPTAEFVNMEIEKFDEIFSNDEKAITLLINTFRKNTEIEEILLKVAVIDKFYSTNIRGLDNLRKMADRIKTLNIDYDLNKGILGAVNKIANNHGIQYAKAKKEINMFSFATKYCNWHNHGAYPIFDSNVKFVLEEYDKIHKYYSNPMDLRDIENLCKTINCFKKYFNIMEFSFKEIDKFFYLYGKELQLQKDNREK